MAGRKPLYERLGIDARETLRAAYEDALNRIDGSKCAICGRADNHAVAAARTIADISERMAELDNAGDTSEAAEQIHTLQREKAMLELELDTARAKIRVLERDHVHR